MELTEGDGTTRPSGHRLDWETNHRKITDAYEAFLDEKKCPTYAELEEATGLSEATITRHIRELKNDTDRLDRFRGMTDSVVIGMARAGRRGDARAGKLFLQYVEGFEERKKVTQVSQNPYAGLSDEDLRKRAEERRAKIAARQKALDVARNV